ncbi:MAG: flagellar export chaperone FlgN [Actinomycetaceae bacterium]|nr:flagellar export chaperone FlgN [Actinomycetaceae bacterium]
MSLDALSRQLWKQRETLEVVLFKLEEERLLVATGMARWLPRATAELEAVLNQAREQELERSMESEAAASALGLEATASLQDIAEAASEPWKTLLLQHRDALVALTTEIGDTAQSNRQQLTMLQRATQETLMSIQESVGTYDQAGATSSFLGSGGRIVDESL